MGQPDIEVNAPPTDKEIIKVDGQISFQNPLAVVDIVFEFFNTIFSNFGNYSIELCAGAEFIASRRFAVVKPPKPTNGK